MTDRTYDTRSRVEILAGKHFIPYLQGTKIDEVGLRELRTLDAFFQWAQNAEVQVPSVEDFLAFTDDTASPRKLENLRTAFDRIAPEGAAICQTIRDAIREIRPRSRACDRRSREAIVAESHFAPYRHLTELDLVTLEDLRVLDRFLIFAQARRIEIPAVEDFLGFVDDRKSSRRLRNLKAALDRLLPGNPAVLLTLQEAIRQKSPPSASKPSKPRPCARYSIALKALPQEWQAALSAMRLGEDVGGLPPPADSTIKNMEEVLREYARFMMDACLPVTITIDGVRRLSAERARRAKEREIKKYKDHGNRPATRHTSVQRIRAFAEHLGMDPLLISALRAHENRLRHDLGTVVPLKFGKLDDIPSLAETWNIATDLRERSRRTQRRQWKLRLLNEAAILALWTLLPLRLADGRLCWGRNIDWTGTGYRADIDTQKADVPLQGRLHAMLTPFLDALVLNGMDPAYLAVMREDAIANELPLFRNTTGGMLAIGHPSQVWSTHTGAGAHISRTRVHTELGKLGPEGVEAALALNAQMDPRSRVFYQGMSVAMAMVSRGQDLMEKLLDEAANCSGEDFFGGGTIHT